MLSARRHAISARFLTIVIVMVLVASQNTRVPAVSAHVGNTAAPALHVSAVNPTLRLTEWTVPTTSGGPWGIAVDPTGKVWFTENGTSKIGMLDPATNKFYEWPTPGGGNPRYIFQKQVSISGSISTRVYFTEFSSDKIAFFDNNTNRLNTFSEWQLPSNSRPVGVFVDENNDIWFTESDRDTIGRLTPSTNALTEWKLPGAGSPGSPLLKPWGIYVQVVPTAGGNNRFVWFANLLGNKVGRLEAVSGRLTLFDLSGLGVYQPMDIAVDTQSNAIFSNINSNRISVLGNTTTTVADYNIPTAGSKPTSVRLDPARGFVWLTEYDAGNIGYVNRTVSRTPTLISSPTCTLPPGTRTPVCTSDPILTTILSSPVELQVNPNVNTQNPAPTAVLSLLTSINGVTEFRLPSTGSHPQSITLDSSGNVWFTESDLSVNKIARVQLIIPPDFRISASPSNQTISQGQSASFALTVNQVSGAPLPVQLSVNNPASLLASFNPPSGTPSPSFTSTLSIGTTTATPVGSYPLTVTASNPNLTRSIGVTLSVQTKPTAPFDFSMTVFSPPNGSATIVQGGSASFDLQISPTGEASPQLVSVSATGLPAGAAFFFSSDNGLPPFTTTLNVQTDVNTQGNTYTITVSGSGGGKSHTAKLTLTITPLPRDFNVTASAYTIQMVQASQKSVELTVNSMGVFQDPVSFTAAISPASSMAVSFSPTSVTPPAGGTTTAKMLIAAPRDVPTGGYTITVTSTGGSITRQLTFTVSVTGCLIATATYGSEVAPQVQFLRNFRDFQIMNTFAGSHFMTAFNAWYYSFSPVVAQIEYHHSTARTAMKIILYPLIGLLQLSSASYSIFAFQPELAALLAGMVASSLIGVAYLALPLAGILWLARHRLQRGTEKRIAKWLIWLLVLLTFGFVVSEIIAASAAMVFVSAAIVLTVLTMGSVLPALAIVEFARRRI